MPNSIYILLTNVLFVLLTNVLFATGLAAQTYRVGTTWSPLYLGDTACTRSWWDPEIYSLTNGDLRVVAQGGNPNAVCGSTPVSFDSIYAATRSAVTGVWALPTTSSCPLIRGGYTRCGWNASNPGPLASPSVASVGGRYYMAFSGGNADYIRGHIYWAVSNDGTNWTIWTHNPDPGDTWSSIVRPLNPVGDPNNGCKGPDPGNIWSVNGVAQLSLVYDSTPHALAANGWFYIFFNYFHQPLAPNYVVGSPPPVDMMAYRFSYDPLHSFGFGTTKQIWHNRQWVNISSGNFLNWNYSGNAQIGSDPILEHNKTMSEDAWPNKMEYGAGTLKWDPDRGWWVWIYNDFLGQMWWQKTATLNTPSWSPRVSVDHSAIADPTPQMVGIWRGTLGSTGPRWWTWVPANTTCGYNSGFYGLALVPGELNYP